MIRTLIWLLGGAVLGAIIHLSVILVLPSFATQDVWARVTALGPDQEIITLDPVEAGAPNPLGLDPKLAYAICRLNLEKGPGEVKGALPKAFWSVSIFNRSGISIYSTTNRSGIGQHLELGIFNAAQTRLLAQQKIGVEDGLLIVESPEDDVFVAVRLAPPHHVMLPRYREALLDLSCENLSTY